jgi:hypothetical protein
LNFAHTHYTYSLRKKQNWGIATFSRFPILKKGTVELENSKNNTCIFTDISVPGNDTFRVYNMHLQSIHLLKEDYKFVAQTIMPILVGCLRLGGINVF